MFRMGESWKRYSHIFLLLISTGLVKIDSYDGFESSDVGEIYKFETGCEHSQRIVCYICHSFNN
jgi:hypothetical protein